MLSLKLSIIFSTMKHKSKSCEECLSSSFPHNKCTVTFSASLRNFVDKIQPFSSVCFGISCPS